MTKKKKAGKSKAAKIRNLPAKRKAVRGGATATATVGRANFDVFTCTKGIDTASTN
ncbi:MAG TPA: hypothetical protein VIZ58_11060 [Thermoanaerobaculia bacterium]